MVSLKETRKSVALDAASLGRLSRLPEQIVEAVAQAREQQEAWQLKRSIQTQLLKSSFQRCIQEAAAVGLVRRLKPVEIVSNPTRIPSEEDYDQFNSSFSGSNRQPRQRRGSILVESHVRRSRAAKARSFQCPVAVLQSMEDQEELLQKWNHSPKPRSHSLPLSPSPAALPSPVVPRWRKRFSAMSPEQMRECLAHQAAEQAFERIWRLQNDPQKELNVRESCLCVYCSSNPSPYQTLEYQRLSKDPTYRTPLPFSDLDWSDDDEDHESDSGSSQNDEKTIDPEEIPSLAIFYGKRPGQTGDFLKEVTNKALDRTLRLVKKGQAHSVRDRCTCKYCTTVSPKQTRRSMRRSIKRGGKKPIPGPPPLLSPSSSPVPPANNKSLLAHHRSLTPPPPSSKKFLVGGSSGPKRWTSIPTKQKEEESNCRGKFLDSRASSSSYNQEQPSWVTPLANRPKINFRKSKKSGGVGNTMPPSLDLSDEINMVTPSPSPHSFNPTSSSGVCTTSSLFGEATSTTAKDDYTVTTVATESIPSGSLSSNQYYYDALDEDVDEEQMLMDELGSLAVEAIE